MNRVKTVGVAVAMALSIAAMSATVASAFQFRAEEYPTPVTASQGTTQKISLGASVTLKCTSSASSGTESEPSAALTQVPTYQGCTLGGTAATVAANSCKYVLHSTSESAPYSGSMDVVCSKEGDAVEIKQGACVVSIPAQSSLGGVEYTNAGTKSSRTLTAALNITGLKNTGSAGCSAKLAGSFTNGTVTGSSVIKGAEGERAIGVYLANGQVEDPPAFFKSEGYPSFVTATQEGEIHFTMLGVNFKCTTNAGTAIALGATVELGEQMGFANCTTGGIEYNVSMNGCYFGVNVSHVQGANATGGLAVRCKESGQEITMNPFGCQLRIPAQGPLSEIQFENGGTGTERLIHASYSVSGLKYTDTSNCTPGSYSDGALSGSWNLKAFADEAGTMGAQRGLWIG